MTQSQGIDNVGPRPGSMHACLFPRDTGSALVLTGAGSRLRCQSPHVLRFLMQRYKVSVQNQTSRPTPTPVSLNSSQCALVTLLPFHFPSFLLSLLDSRLAQI